MHRRLFNFLKALTVVERLGLPGPEGAFEEKLFNFLAIIEGEVEGYPKVAAPTPWRPFLDVTLKLDPAIACRGSFYLVLTRNVPTVAVRTLGAHSLVVYCYPFVSSDMCPVRIHRLPK